MRAILQRGLKMSTIVTLSRGAQSATPFGYNAGDASADRGSAFFTDFYTIEPFTKINCPLIDGACGLAKQTTNGSSQSTLKTSKIFTQREGDSVSFAARLKVTNAGANDSLNVGFTDDHTKTLQIADFNFGININNFLSDKITISFDDGKTDKFLNITTSALPSEFDVTEFNVYGAELIRLNGTNTCHYFINGHKIHTVVSTPDAGATMDAMSMALYSPAGDVQSQFATFDWASISMPRT